MGTTSPFAPKRLAYLPAIDGVRIATAAAGIRYPGRIDLLLALFDPGTTVAGVLTKSKTASAPVDWCRAHLAHGMARALVVNSGNANAFTGKRGREAVRMTAEAAARAADCLEADVYVASTGVIGEPLDARKFTGLLGDLARDHPGRAAHRSWRRSAACHVPLRAPRGDARSRPADRQGRRGPHQIRDGEGARRREQGRGARHRQVDRQFSSGQDGDRRRR